MRGVPEQGRIPLMGADKAQEIARGLQWLAQSDAEAGMRRDASRAGTECQWWVAHAISLAQTPPAPGEQAG